MSIELIRKLRNALSPSQDYALIDECDAYLREQERGAPFDMLAHLRRQREWSEQTFGPGARTAGVCDHIRKELREIEADPLDVKEWIDVVILALDGAWRAGFTPQQIVDALVAKQTKNEGRTWPDWRTAPTDKAIEHLDEFCQRNCFAPEILGHAVSCKHWRDPKSPTASAPADAPVAWYRNGPRGFVFSADLELESVWPRRSEGWIPLYATPPAPASGAVSDEDIEASARAIYATANKNYIGWPAAVQFADDALRTFASRHASQPAGAVGDEDANVVPERPRGLLEAVAETLRDGPRQFDPVAADRELRAAGFKPCPTCGNVDDSSPAQAVSVPIWRFSPNEAWQDGTPTAHNFAWGAHAGYTIETAMRSIAVAPSPPQHDKRAAT